MTLPELTMTARPATLPSTLPADEIPGFSWSDLERLIAHQLAPRVNAIDQAGEYPEDFLRALGKLGGYRRVAAPAHGGRRGRRAGRAGSHRADPGATCACGR